MNKVTIIDFVGAKGGMHDYSIQLLDALVEQEGFEAFYFSNISEYQNSKVHISKLYDLNLKKNFKGLINFLYSTYLASKRARIHHVNWAIVHLFEFSPITTIFLFIIKLFRLKTICVVHDIDSFEKEDVKWSKFLIFRYLSNRLIVHNEFSRESLFQELNFDVGKKMAVIPHGNFVGLSENKDPKSTLKEAIENFSHGEFILFFGQIKKVKGLDVLLNALRQTDPQIKLVIAGKTWKDESDKYHQIIKQNGIEQRIMFINRYIEDEERDYLFKTARFIVLPYKKIYQSGVMLMALSKQLAVLASDLPPNQDMLLDGEYGVLFDSENELDLTQKINELYFDSSKLQLLREKGLEYVSKRYSWTAIASSYANLMKD